MSAPNTTSSMSTACGGSLPNDSVVSLIGFLRVLPEILCDEEAKGSIS